MINNIQDKYKKQTGGKALYRKDASDYHTLKYVKWLEQELSKDSEMLNESDIKHLKWMYGRMRTAHNEPPNIDYMLRFRKILNKLDLTSAMKQQADTQKTLCEHDWIPTRWIMVCEKCKLASKIITKTMKG